MNTLGIDALRADIFKELMKLDKEKLSEVYRFVKKLASKEASEVRLLQDILDKSADYAVKAYERGDFRSTQDVMGLQDDKLREGHRFVKSLVDIRETKDKEYVMPDDLLQKVAEYTMKNIENEGPYYTTDEVDEYINRRMGW